jgi:hypothetical protein
MLQVLVMSVESQTVVSCEVGDPSVSLTAHSSELPVKLSMAGGKKQLIHYY